MFETRFGTYEVSYDNLPRMLSQVAAYLVPAVTRGQRIMQRAFFCIGACVRAFQCCLSVICIDGTFLTGRYKGQILTAIGVYCNNQIVPLAFAFVENENIDSWYWSIDLTFYARIEVVVVSLEIVWYRRV